MLDDFVYGEVSRISPEAPAPVLAVTKSELLVGGAGNVARNIAALGARCIFVGVVGDDEASRIAHAGACRRIADRAPSGGRPFATDDAQGSLRLRASLDSPAARRLGDGRGDPMRIPRRPCRSRAGRAAAGGECCAVRLCQGRAHAAGIIQRRDRGGTQARQAGDRRSQGQGFFDLQGRHPDHAEPAGARRGDAACAAGERTEIAAAAASSTARSAARQYW